MPKNSRMSLAGDPFKKHADERLFDDLSADVLQTVLNNCELESSEGHHSLLFIDDCGSALKNNTIQKLLKKLIFNRRHLKLSIMILCQSYQSMPLDIRKNISHLVMFKPRNKKELEILFDELVFLPKDQQVLLNNHVFDTPHNFLFVNTGNGKLYKNFNQLEIEF